MSYRVPKNKRVKNFTQSRGNRGRLLYSSVSHIVIRFTFLVLVNCVYQQVIINFTYWASKKSFIWQPNAYTFILTVDGVTILEPLNHCFRFCLYRAVKDSILAFSHVDIVRLVVFTIQKLRFYWKYSQMIEWLVIEILGGSLIC